MHLHMIAGLRFNREGCCDQNNGIEPLCCTTDAISFEQP